RTAVLFIASALLLFSFGSETDPRHVPATGYREWKVYGGGSESIRYSKLDQINRSNVQKLETAWTFDTGDAFPGSEMQCNPVIAGGLLFATTPKLRVVALDAATGKLRWSFDPNDGSKITHAIRNRGVTYWEEGRDRRILFASRHFLYAPDARSGEQIRGFGKEGRVDVRGGLGRDPPNIWITGSTNCIV